MKGHDGKQLEKVLASLYIFVFIKIYAFCKVIKNLKIKQIPYRKFQVEGGELRNLEMYL